MDKLTAPLIVERLRNSYPDARCELNFDTPFQLLVAVIMSAQCTDVRVNKVSRELFRTYSTPQDFAALSVEELGKLIYSCGYYNNKAKSIIGASRGIIDKFGGEVPSTVEELLTLSGVGRKTANVVVSNVFGVDAIAVDTHCFRVAHRLGISQGKTADKVEADLNAFFPQSDWSAVHHLLIFHGRYTCHSQRPACDVCTLKEYCKYYKENNQ